MIIAVELLFAYRNILKTELTLRKLTKIPKTDFKNRLLS